jgi:hypothetical protein
MKNGLRPALWVALLLLVSLPLLGALATSPAPVVVVYPLTASGNGEAEAGSNIAILYSTKLIQLGGIDVKPYTPGTARADYLSAAQNLGADYYVSGFVTALGGTEVSIVTQLVSTASGSVVYSATTLATTYADAATEADVLHDVILAHASRGYALEAPQPSASPTPLGKGGIDVGKVLRHRSRATPLPSASPASASLASSGTLPASAAPPRPAAAASPPPGDAALLLNVAGDSDDSARASTLAALGAAFRRAGVSSGHLPVGADQIAHAATLCGANAGAHALYAPTLTLTRSPQGSAQSVQLDLVGYDCSGTRLGSAHVVERVGRRLGDALSAAAGHAVAALLASGK